jgi:hypothetical protein
LGAIVAHDVLPLHIRSYEVEDGATAHTLVLIW